MIAIRIFAAVSLLTTMAAHADGALDAAWGSHGQYPDGGRSTIAFNLGGSNADQGFATALQVDGKLVIAGSAATAMSSGVRDIAVTRLLADGTLDTHFATAGRFTYNFGFPGLCNNDDVATAVASDAAGRLVVAGTASCNPNATDANKNTAFVLRLLADGTLDADFGTGGIVLRYDATHSYGYTALALYVNTIFVAAYGDYPAVGSSEPFFDVYDSSGTLVSNFSVAEFDGGSRATSISVDAFGDVTLGGYYGFAAAGAEQTLGYDCFVARATRMPAGDYVTGGRTKIRSDFGGDYNDRCYAHAVDSHGDVWMVGDSTDATNSKTATIYHVTGGGSFAGGANFYFFNAPVPSVNSLRAVAVDSRDRILAAGYSQVADPAYAPFNFVVTRRLADLSPDVSFQDGGPLSDDGYVSVGFETAGSGTDDGAFALALDSANRVYAVGQHQLAGSNYDMAAARLRSDALFIDGFENTSQ